jgi:drug/metabolite transporter (DMT)-like permease
VTVRARALAAAATTGLLVGAAMVSTRAVSAEASPETLAFLRYLIGTAFLAAPALRGGLPRFRPADAVAVAGLGVLQFAALIVLLNHALVELPAATCSLVFSTMPLFTLAMAVAGGRERLRLLQVVGVLLAALGIAVLLGPSAAQPVDVLARPGALAALLGATVLGAACSLLYRPYLARYAALPVSLLAMCASVVFLAALCLLTGQPLWPGLSASGAANVVFIGLSSGVGYFCWIWALGRLEASRAVGFQVLGPVTAAAIELALGHYAPTVAMFVAIALVVLGLSLSQRGVPRG